MPATASWVKRAGELAATVSRSRPSNWFTPHMAAASRAIADRLLLVDLILEIRDARIPLSSEFELLKRLPSSSRRIVVLNKIDLANRMQIKDWMEYFRKQNCIYFGVDCHNDHNIIQFLRFIQARVAELQKPDPFAAVMLVGIPNVGKSALVNALNRLGRIRTEDRGKFRPVVVSQMPGETKNIKSMKIASNPNIYVLDTPGVLPPWIPNVELCFKLVLTGAISEGMIQEKELAQYFLALLNLSNEYKQWSEVSCISNDRSSVVDMASTLSASNVQRRRRCFAVQSQDVVVQRVHRALYMTISSLNVNSANEADFGKLIDAQFLALREAFRLPREANDDDHCETASKLLDLYRNGMLSNYTLDRIPGIA